MRFRAVVPLGILSVGMLLFLGCSAGQQADLSADVRSAADAARAAGSEENAAALSDGELTVIEYYEASRRYQECYSAAGITLPAPVLSPVDNLTLEWAYPEEARTAAGKTAHQLDACDGQWAPVVVAASLKSTWMDPDLADVVANCMERKGYSISAEAEDVADFVGEPLKDGGRQRAEAEKCIIDHARTMFPELPKIAVPHGQ